MYDAEKLGIIQIQDIKKNNDYAMWLKLCRKADCWLLNEVLASYRRREGSISSHSYLTLIRWHYLLFRKAEDMGVVCSAICTLRNLLCGIYKKLSYVKRKGSGL